MTRLSLEGMSPKARDRLARQMAKGVRAAGSATETILGAPRRAPNPPTPYRCRACGETFERWSKAERHARAEHHPRQELALPNYQEEPPHG